MVFDTRYNKGFTLAETLIALVVVGIVAAVTVPTLVARYQKDQTLTQLKRGYSALAQTTNRAIADNGPIATWEFGGGDSGNAAIAFLNKYVVPYMSVMKAPERKNSKWNVTYVNLDNSKLSLDASTVRFILNDGTTIYSRTSEKNNGEKRVNFNIDINGDKKPNKVGRDLFYFTYYIDSPSPERKGKILPNDFDLSREELAANEKYRCHKGRSGDCCAALIIKDGWQIKNDYPW